MTTEVTTYTDLHTHQQYNRACSWCGDQKVFVFNDVKCDGSPVYTNLMTCIHLFWKSYLHVNNCILRTLSKPEVAATSIDDRVFSSFTVKQVQSRALFVILLL